MQFLNYSAEYCSGVVRIQKKNNRLLKPYSHEMRTGFAKKDNGNFRVSWRDATHETDVYRRYNWEWFSEAIN